MGSDYDALQRCPAGQFLGECLWGYQALCDEQLLGSFDDQLLWWVGCRVYGLIVLVAWCWQRSTLMSWVFAVASLRACTCLACMDLRTNCTEHHTVTIQLIPILDQTYAL